jgi:beta-glucosidase/6-phospho-beta-glucosidase/beta-galactosidase
VLADWYGREMCQVRDGDYKIIAQPIDFFGLNYYTVESVAFDLRVPGQLFGRGYFPEGADLSPTGYLANEPEGLWQALSWAHSYDLPIYVTENAYDRLPNGHFVPPSERNDLNKFSFIRRCASSYK